MGIFGCMQLPVSRIIVFALFVLFGLSNCTERRNQNEDPLGNLPADFSSFYQQFHTDTAFQLTHIVFPLKGLRGDNVLDSNGIALPWVKETWKLHKRIENMRDYQQTFDVLSDDLIVETIEERDAPIAMQRRFARMSDGWHLIFYAEMQPQSRRKSN